jgi:hypothetical protein
MVFPTVPLGSKIGRQSAEAVLRTVLIFLNDPQFQKTTYLQCELPVGTRVGTFTTSRLECFKVCFNICRCVVLMLKCPMTELRLNLKMSKL